MSKIVLNYYIISRNKISWTQRCYEIVSGLVLVVFCYWFVFLYFQDWIRLFSSSVISLVVFTLSRTFCGCLSLVINLAAFLIVLISNLPYFTCFYRTCSCIRSGLSLDSSLLWDGPCSLCSLLDCFVLVSDEILKTVLHNSIGPWMESWTILYDLKLLCLFTNDARRASIHSFSKMN